MSRQADASKGGPFIWGVLLVSYHRGSHTDPGSRVVSGQGHRPGFGGGIGGHRGASGTNLSMSKAARPCPLGTNHTLGVRFRGPGQRPWRGGVVRRKGHRAGRAKCFIILEATQSSVRPCKQGRAREKAIAPQAAFVEVYQRAPLVVIHPINHRNALSGHLPASPPCHRTQSPSPPESRRVNFPRA